MDAAVAALGDIPKRYALPAAAAVAGYLNAKYGLAADAAGIFKITKSSIAHKKMEKQDRVNVFYALEKWAKDPQGSKRIFLMVPPDDDHPNAQTQWTYAEAYETILRYAAWLKEKHMVQRREIIAMDFTNRPQFVWLWFALWSLGAIPAFINSNLRENAFIHCVKISTSRLLLIDPVIRDVLTDDTRRAMEPDDKGRAVELVVLDPELEREALASTPFRAPDSARSGEAMGTVAMLVYTSGTTGLPKAANVNWNKPLASMTVFSSIMNLKPEDRYFTAMPLYHSSASVLGVCQVFGPGCTVIIAPKFSPRTYMKMVSETDATAIQYIGEACRYLVSSPATPYDQKHHVTRAFGNGLRADVWQRFKDRFNIPTIVEFYGATEGPGASIVNSRNDFLRGAIGRQGLVVRTLLQNNIFVKHDHATDAPYRDPKTGFCVRCATNETGELIHPLDAKDIKAQYIGYHGNDKATQSKVLFDVFKKGDAYYRTGDLQRQDRDGRVYFMDRIGDTFRWKSENVSTAEVSEALGTHPAVREANVYGVQLPGHDGRAGCAAISLADGHAALDSSLARDLAAHARRALPRYAVPLFLRLTHEVEVTGTMKHQKVALRNQGVDPAQTQPDEMFWLKPGADAYAPFGEEQWKGLQAGQVKL